MNATSTPTPVDLTALERDIDMADAEVQRLQSDADQVMLDLAAATSRASGLRSLRDLTRKVYGLSDPESTQESDEEDGQEAPDAEPPVQTESRNDLEGMGLREALLTVFAESEGDAWTLAALIKELPSRGWTSSSSNPASVVRTATHKLSATHPNIVRVGHGKYAFHKDPEAVGEKQEELKV